MTYTKCLIGALALTSLIACTAISQPSDNALAVAELENILALGKVYDLNTEPTPWEKDLLVRLYEVPLSDGACFEETHGICQNKYYITTSTIDEYPDINFSALGIDGDLVSYKWLEDDSVDFVRISLKMRNFTVEATRNNPSLETNVRDITVELYADYIDVLEK